MAQVVTDRQRFAFASAMGLWRRKHKVTQEHAARMVGVPRSQWARWERGEVFPLTYETEINALIQRDPHEGLARQARFYRRDVRVNSAPQRRLPGMLDRSDTRRPIGPDHGAR